MRCRLQADCINEQETSTHLWPTEDTFLRDHSITYPHFDKQ